jgi:hypothetical protein
LADHAVLAGDGHEQSFGCAPSLWPRSGRKTQNGGDQPYPAGAPGPGNIGGHQREAQRGQQPFRRYGARLPERSADILVMDERFDQADPAAQRRGQPAGLRVICQRRRQLLRAACAGLDALRRARREAGLSPR